MLAGRCGTGDDRYSRRVGSRGRRGPGWPGADAGQVDGPVLVPGPGRPDVPAQTSHAPMAAAGLGVLVVCGVLVANRTVLGTDVAVFRRVNHWPGGCIRRCGRSSCRERSGLFPWWPPRPRC